MPIFCFQDGLRNTDFSSTLTVFGLKPRSGNIQVFADLRLLSLLNDNHNSDITHFFLVLLSVLIDLRQCGL